MQTENTTPTVAPQPEPEPQPQENRSRFRRPRFLFRERTSENPGQAIVEFAIVSIAFFMMVFGTIDFGRAVYMYSQLHNAVQEGAHMGKTNPVATNHPAIQDEVMSKLNAFNPLDIELVDVTCRDKDGNELADIDCDECAKIQVDAIADFQAITQNFLGIEPISLKASAVSATE